ncbi:COP1-interactive protein 1-like [Gossypium hirsutum]|uniref:COP1-interactive protein 1-like n=1 Tax=Gossypium hirsutum TaxID=3635 RepID=A0ABM2YNE0_GOSHI|nr:COP1-interactive protein 1-like [Gossypium hirsutum]
MRWRPPKNSSNVGNSHSGTKDSTVRFEAWALARAYAIQACEEASTLEVITDRVVYRVFFEDYSPLKDIVASTRRVDVPEENWIALLQNLQSKDVEWRHGLRQFVPATQGLAQSEFVYRGANYKRNVSEVSSAWKKAYRLNGVAINPATTPEYVEWRGRRVNDKIPKPNVEGAQLIEEYLRVMPLELEIMKQEFERKNLEFEKRVAKLEEEKMYLSLDVDVQKMEVEKESKENRKIEEDRDDLKEHYKKAQVSLRRARVGGSSDQLQKEVQEEKARAEYWERKFQEMQSQNLALEEENKGLKTKVTELGRSLRWHRNHDSTVKLEELKSKVEDLEVPLHDGELRIEQLEAQEDCLKEELHQVKGQVRDRDYIIGEAIAQIREVTEYV